LNFITAQTQDAYSLKRSVLVFSLLHSDLRLLIRHMEDEFVKRKHPDQHFVQLIESTTYSLSMELRKVMQRELVGAAALQQHDWIFAKIQNSSGILANAIQQVVFSVAQYFDPGLKGAELFPDYVPKLEQSVQLQSDLKNLLEDSRKFETAGNIRQISALVRKIEAFRSGSMKYLMFKDWMNFDNLYHEIAACKTAGNLAFSMHRFVALLSTLLKEVSKRSILQKN
jgi:hypothetical protein